ncbi:hypothetical protein MIMGU_mgv1a026001mg [Erythranthe guttata]|uniref:AAA+ ATPase domain-containing protein n=1 Tax=Erythranthe guttata TaxID=4155 RepID=A0A022QH51_ERYGU|nr:hypothetical protein MIMGU_mgv1a026001mg [Erythranthe guttata]
MKTDRGKNLGQLSERNTSITIHECAKSGDLVALQTLLQHNPSLLNQTNRPMLQTPLHMAASFNRVEIIEYLLDWEGQGIAEMEAKNVNGETPLHVAAKNGYNEAVTMLLNRGAYSKATTNMDEFERELSKIVGLRELKRQLKTWAKGMLMDEKRRAMGVNLGPRKAPHMAFLGNPGTGKTTVARILGKLLQSVGVLSSDSVTEVQRSDLVGEYIGQTGPKTRKKIEEAMGGTLFVDEAYRLAPERSAGHTQDYGVEALEEIMSVLEDGNIVVIFAGYTEPMKRVFSSNEGFCRRVSHFFTFDDFTCKDLAQMLKIKMSKQDEKSRLFGFKLHPSCTSGAILELIEKNSTEKLRNKLNGGLVDHMLNNARENLDSRLNLDSTGDELLTITLSDLEAGLKMLSRRMNVE